MSGGFAGIWLDRAGLGNPWDVLTGLSWPELGTRWEPAACGQFTREILSGEDLSPLGRIDVEVEPVEEQSDGLAEDPERTEQGPIVMSRRGPRSKTIPAVSRPAMDAATPWAVTWSVRLAPMALDALDAFVQAETCPRLLPVVSEEVVETRSLVLVELGELHPAKNDGYLRTASAWSMRWWRCWSRMSSAARAGPLAIQCASTMSSKSERLSIADCRPNPKRARTTDA